MMKPSIHQPEHAYIASDGRVTIWHRSTRRLQSATIREFSQQWQVKPPSGIHSYPVFSITRYQYRHLKDLADCLRTVSRIDNAALPRSIRAVLASKPVRDVAAVETVETAAVEVF